MVEHPSSSSSSSSARLNSRYAALSLFRLVAYSAAQHVQTAEGGLKEAAAARAGDDGGAANAPVAAAHSLTDAHDANVASLLESVVNVVAARICGLATAAVSAPADEQVDESLRAAGLLALRSSGSAWLDWQYAQAAFDRYALPSSVAAATPGATLNPEVASLVAAQRREMAEAVAAAQSESDAELRDVLQASIEELARAHARDLERAKAELDDDSAAESDGSADSVDSAVPHALVCVQQNQMLWTALRLCEFEPARRLFAALDEFVPLLLSLSLTPCEASAANSTARCLTFRVLRHLLPHVSPSLVVDASVFVRSALAGIGAGSVPSLEAAGSVAAAAQTTELVALMRHLAVAPKSAGRDSEIDWQTAVLGCAQQALSGARASLESVAGAAEDSGVSGDWKLLLGAVTVLGGNVSPLCDGASVRVVTDGDQRVAGTVVALAADGATATVRVDGEDLVVAIGSIAVSDELATPFPRDFTATCIDALLRMLTRDLPSAAGAFGASELAAHIGREFQRRALASIGALIASRPEMSRRLLALGGGDDASTAAFPFVANLALGVLPASQAARATEQTARVAYLLSHAPKLELQARFLIFVFSNHVSCM